MLWVKSVCRNSRELETNGHTLTSKHNPQIITPINPAMRTTTTDMDSGASNGSNPGHDDGTVRKTGLTAGAAARIGIGIGAAAGVLITGALVWLVMRNKRRRRRRREEKAQGNDEAAASPQTVYEMSMPGPVVELDAKMMPKPLPELEAGSVSKHTCRRPCL